MVLRLERNVINDASTNVQWQTTWISYKICCSGFWFQLSFVKSDYQKSRRVFFGVRVELWEWEQTPAALSVCPSRCRPRALRHHGPRTRSCRLLLTCPWFLFLILIPSALVTWGLRITTAVQMLNLRVLNGSHLMQMFLLKKKNNPVIRRKSPSTVLETKNCGNIT